MALLVTDLDPIIKQIYLPKMIKIVKGKNTLQQEIDKRKQVITVGKKYTKAYQTAMSEGIGMAAYNGALPTAGAAAYATIEGTVKHMYGTIQIYKADLTFTDTDAKAFVDGVQNELLSIAEALKLESEIMWQGDGGASPRAIASNAVHSNGVVTMTVDSTRYLRNGMPVDFKETNGSAIASGTGIPILKVVNGTTFTVDGDGTFATAAADAYVFHAGGKDAEFNGLKNLIGTNNNTLAGVNRSTVGNEFWVPNCYRIASAGGVETSITAAANRDWRILDLRKVIERDLVETNNADTSDLAIICSSSVSDYLLALRQAQGEYHSQSESNEVWPYQRQTFDGIRVICPPFAKANSMAIPHMGSLVEFRNQDFKWEDYDGSMWDRVSGYDAFTAYFSKRGEYYVLEPNKSAYIIDMKGADD